MIPTRILTLRLTLTFGLTLTLTLPNHSAPHPNLKVALMEKLDALLTPLPGAVELTAPKHIVSLIEDCRGPLHPTAPSVEPHGGGDARRRMAYAPSHLLVGRQLASGDAAHLNRFSLSRRPYLGRTTLPPSLALLMANQAQVRDGSLVLDPYCGTASTLLSCAARGARTVGVEIDARVLEGGEGGCGIATNFKAAGLSPPETLLLGDAGQIGSAELLPPSDERYARFDAIVTDPPYGVMEGLGRLHMPLRERLLSLLCLAARRLRIGGRLVFLLPIPAGSSAQDALCLDALPPTRSPPTLNLTRTLALALIPTLPPLSPSPSPSLSPPPSPLRLPPPSLPSSPSPSLRRCLELEAISRQPLSLRMHRLMVTLRKAAEPRSEDEAYPSFAVDPGKQQPAEARDDGSLVAADGWVRGALAPWDEWWREEEEEVEEPGEKGEEL